MRYVTFHKSASKLGPIYIYILCVLLETAGQTKGVLIAAYTLEPRDKYKSTTYSTAKGSPVAWYSGRVFALTKKKPWAFLRAWSWPALSSWCWPSWTWPKAAIIRDVNNHLCIWLLILLREQVTVNPLTTPARKFPGWKVHAHACEQYIFGPITNQISILCLLWKSIYMLMRKRKQK